MILCGGVPRLSAKALRLLSSLWSVPGVVDHYTAALLSCEAGDATLVLAAHYLAWLAGRSQHQQPMATVKTAMLDMLCKVVVTSKTKTAANILHQLAPLLRLVTHQEFKETLLPVMAKALLRSPEISLSCVGPILAGLSLDLSPYVPDLSKHFATNLNSKVIKQNINPSPIQYL